MGEKLSVEQFDCEDENLVEEYKEFKGGKNRPMSVNEFTKRIKQKLEKENRPNSAEFEEQIRELFHDKDHIGFQEFLTWKVKTGARTDLPRLLKELFKNVDDGDGFLSPEELVKLEEKLNKSISTEDAEDIIRTWDSNGDGKMTVDEFIEYKTATMHFRPLSAPPSM